MGYCSVMSCVWGCFHRLGLWMACRKRDFIKTYVLPFRSLILQQQRRWKCVYLFARGRKTESTSWQVSGCPVLHCGPSSMCSACLPHLLTDALQPFRVLCSSVLQKTTSRRCPGSSLWSPVSTRTSTRSPTSAAPCARGFTTSGSVSTLAH